MATELKSGKTLELKEINLKKIHSKKQKKDFYAVHHDGEVYFISQSLRNDDGTPNKKAFQQGIQLGTITEDGDSTNVCWKSNSWEAVSLLLEDKEVVGA